MAQLGGFDRPILHGLCTYGICARLIYEKFCNKDPSMIKSYAARFTSHVFPGETLTVEAYKDGNQIVFEAKTKERGKVAEAGVIELRQDAKL